MIQASVQQWLNSSEDELKGIIRPYSERGNIEIGWVIFEDKTRRFRIREDFDGNTYDMDADRITTSAGFLDFLFQVHSKPWVTSQHIKDLLDCVTCWGYRETKKFPQMFFDVACSMNRVPETKRKSRYDE